jgi:NAD-specific glutamate dehydrogenase
MALEINGLALSKNLDFEAAALVFFYLGAELKMFELRARAEKLKTETVWQDLARVEFIQELNRLQASLTADALNYFTRDSDPQAVLEIWSRKNVAVIKRYNTALDRMRFTEGIELAIFPVILRKLNDFKRSSDSGEPD